MREHCGKGYLRRENYDSRKEGEVQILLFGSNQMLDWFQLITFMVDMLLSQEEVI